MQSDVVLLVLVVVALEFEFEFPDPNAPNGAECTSLTMSAGGRLIRSVATSVRAGAGAGAGGDITHTLTTPHTSLATSVA